MTLVSPSSAQWNEQKLSEAALAPRRMYPILVGSDYGFTDSPTGVAFAPNVDGSLSIDTSPGADAIQLMQLGNGPILFPT